MNVFKRYSTAAYDSRNLSILNVDSLTSPRIVTIDPRDFRTIFSLIFTPGDNLTSDDTEMTNAMLFQIGWFLRLYQDEFPDNKYTPLNFLRGLLTVPIQFTVTAWQFVNATVSALDPESTSYALPDDLKTTASSARRTYRALTAMPWIVYTFIAMVSVLLLCGNIILTFAWSQKMVAPNTSSFSEVDASSKSAHSLTQQPLQDYSSALQNARLGNASSGKIVRGVKNKRIRVVEIDDVRHNEKCILLVVTDVDGEIERLQGLSTEVRY